MKEPTCSVTFSLSRSLALRRELVSRHLSLRRTRIGCVIILLQLVSLHPFHFFSSLVSKADRIMGNYSLRDVLTTDPTHWFCLFYQSAFSCRGINIHYWWLIYIFYLYFNISFLGVVGSHSSVLTTAKAKVKVRVYVCFYWSPKLKTCTQLWMGQLTFKHVQHFICLIRRSVLECHMML